MNGKRSFKKRLAGLLAMSLVLAMMMGMTVNATPYYVSCTNQAQGSYVDGLNTYYAYMLCDASDCETLANVSTLSGGDEIIQMASSGELEIIFSDNSNPGVTLSDTDPHNSYVVPDGTYELVEIEKVGEKRGILTLRTLASAVASCSHGGVESKVIKEPTETEDGIIGYYCTGCGELLSTESTSSYAYFLKTIIDKINKAEPGSTVEISSKIWNSLSQDVMLAMAARRDINIVMTFRYQHEDYQYNIPAGTAIDTVDKYYGPMYLGQLYGMTKLEK